MKYLHFFVLCICLLPTSLFAQVIFYNDDINTGADDSHPSDFVTFKNRMYFSATTSYAGRELYVTNSGYLTKIFFDINVGPGSSNPQMLGEVNGKLLFSADDADNGIELWCTDGTVAGTGMLKDISPGKTSGFNNGTSGVKYNGKIYFSAATPADGNELWVSDGTLAGTYMLADINPGSSSSYPLHFNVCNGKIIFRASDATHGNEVWVTDGTTAGTMLLKDINPSGSSYRADYSLVSNGLCYFWANSAGSGNDVKAWVTDGTPTGTRPLNGPTPGGVFISKFVAYKSKVYYWNSQDTGIGAQLWVTDGTAAGTHVFSNAAPNTVMHFSRDFLVFKNKLYFTGGLYRLDTMSGCELWETDGTEAGTKLVVDIAGSHSSAPYMLTPLGNYLYFIASDSPSAYKLYRTDGTAAGTKQIAPRGPASNNPMGNTMEIYTFRDKLWMNASFTSIGQELWNVTNAFEAGIDATEETSAHITLYPSPAHHNFTIKTTTAFTNGNVTLTDVTGRVVMTKKLYNNQQTIPLQGITPGIYIADVWLDDKRSTQKLVVE